MNSSMKEGVLVELIQQTTTASSLAITNSNNFNNTSLGPFSNQNNITNFIINSADETSYQSTTSKFITLCICWLIIVIGNSMVIAVQWIYQRKQIPNYLIQVLAWIDLVNALCPVLISIVMYRVHPDGFQGVTNNHLCYFYNSAATMLRLSACFVMTMMALDRAVSVQLPFYYRTQLRLQTVKRWVTFFVVISLVIACLPLTGLSQVIAYKTVCSFDFGSGYAVGMVILGYLQLLTVLLCYIIVVKGLFGYVGRQVARRQQQSFIEMTSSTRAKLAGRRKSSSGILMRDISNFRVGKQFAKMTAVISVLFYASWMPIVLSITVRLVTGKYSLTLQLLSARMSLVSSIANPIAYALLSKTYREGYVYCFKWIFCLCSKTRPNNPAKRSSILELINETRANSNPIVLPKTGSPYFVISKPKASDSSTNDTAGGKRIGTEKSDSTVRKGSRSNTRKGASVSFSLDTISGTASNANSDDEYARKELHDSVRKASGDSPLGFDGDSEDSSDERFDFGRAGKFNTSPVRGRKRKVKRKTLSADTYSYRSRSSIKRTTNWNLLELPRRSLTDGYGTDHTDATDVTDIEPDCEVKPKTEKGMKLASDNGKRTVKFSECDV